MQRKLERSHRLERGESGAVPHLVPQHCKLLDDLGDQHGANDDDCVLAYCLWRRLRTCGDGLRLCPDLMGATDYIIYIYTMVNLFNPIHCIVRMTQVEGRVGIEWGGEWGGQDTGAH